MLALHHIHKRKRRQKVLNKKISLNPFDYLVYVISIAGPVMTIPQIYDIWVKGNKGVSLITWQSYLVFTCIWLVYGFMHKEKPIIISNILWLVAQGLVVTGIMFY